MYLLRLEFKKYCLVFFKNLLSTNKFLLYANVNSEKIRSTKSIMTGNNRKCIVIANFIS